MNARRRLTGYSQLVSSAIGLDEAATLELVERLDERAYERVAAARGVLPL